MREKINRNSIDGMKKIKLLDMSRIIPDIVIPIAEYVGMLFLSLFFLIHYDSIMLMDWKIL
ncbi:hypothetical protein CON65_12445 [Bacillus pseudomycoides]|uniref:Uncharacterized protein n=1 Tax=Bacillus pseudomycoides TaxID=64104 RepID=A0AA91ZT85_9BACI|nr:hypothetical protein COO03_24950 [Bacillus sp. AFS098217]PED82329.1 hypothetical protein CON65_12445 [Bacillus pseudomycoides]PEU12632.1 hypothetical protein CN524_12750 [Bacillus sp. AFS019443]PEU12742.1 hypothetical protein CN525_20625 [Bacillus sp. AFS014408]PFW60134.1 hypothetical protein COL20_23010 [Bacillus sp. AFS075034]